MTTTTATEDEHKLAPFNPSCSQAQEHALEMMKLTGDDVLFDLGCGDGRILIKAASNLPGLRCVGIELDAKYVDRGKKMLQESALDVSERVDMRVGSVLDSQVQNGGALSLEEDATAIFLYILPKGMVRLQPYLEELMRRRGEIRIAAYMFSLRGWEPVAVDRRTKGECPIYLYDSTSLPPAPGQQ
jgi:hypothetical protein